MRRVKSVEEVLATQDFLSSMGRRARVSSSEVIPELGLTPDELMY